MKLPNCLLAGIASITLSQCVAAAPAEEANPTDTARLTLGAGFGAAPRYPGSKEQQLQPALMVDYDAGNGFFAGTARGIGFGAVAGPLQWSAALSYDGGRSEKEGRLSSGSRELRGMGRVEGSALALITAGVVPFEGAGLSLVAAVPLSHRERGTSFQLAGSAALARLGGGELSAELNLNFADRRYAQTFFGVTPQQSASSGYRAHAPGRGLLAIGGGLSWSFELDERWGLRASLGATRLVGDAARSPIVHRRTSPTAGLMLSRDW